MATFTSEETQILVDLLKKNHLQLTSGEDVAHIGYLVRHIRNSFKASIDKNAILLEPALVKDPKFFEYIAFELEWLSENEKTTDKIIKTCEKLFDIFTAEPNEFQSSGIQYPII